MAGLTWAIGCQSPESPAESTAPPPPIAPSLPNIIVIVADDLAIEGVAGVEMGVLGKELDKGVVLSKVDVARIGDLKLRAGVLDLDAL